MAEDTQTDRLVTINDKQFDLNSLSEKAKKQLNNIRMVDLKLEEATNQMAVLRAARRYYTSELEKEMPELTS